MDHKISIVVAIGDGRMHNRVLGKENKLLWHIPDDMKRFRTITNGHPIIMGRKTFESIISYRGKPLPNRTNIVLTRDPAWHYDGVLRAGTMEEAIELAKEQPGSEEIFIGGGGEVYALALPYVDKLYLTLIEDDQEGDSFFPEYEHEFTKKTFDEKREYEGVKYSWVDLVRTSTT